MHPPMFAHHFFLLISAVYYYTRSPSNWYMDWSLFTSFVLEPNQVELEQSRFCSGTICHGVNTLSLLFPLLSTMPGLAGRPTPFPTPSGHNKHNK